jgi:uncharacterized damage-inducible protein DinB
MSPDRWPIWKRNQCTGFWGSNDGVVAMSEAKRIADQARKMFEGGAWHGPSVLEVLSNVDVETVAAHPIPDAHSIWELVLHLIATQDAILHRIRGEQKGLKTEDYWLPVPDVTEANWHETIERLKQQEVTLREAIGSFPDERLDSVLVEGGSSAYNNFHGHIQHNAYHAGQIALLVKAQKSNPLPF